MRKLILVVFAFAVISICSAAVSAQNETRIKFGNGAVSAIVTGELNSFGSHKIFIIRVRKGQTLKTKNAGKKYITVGVDTPPDSMWEPDLWLDCHASHEVSPTVAGDYKIAVTECMKADPWRGTFRLRVSVH